MCLTPTDGAAGLGNCWGKVSSTPLRFNQQVVCLTGRKEEKYLERFSCEPFSNKGEANREGDRKLKITGKFKEGTDASRVKTDAMKSTFVFLL